MPSTPRTSRASRRVLALVTAATAAGSLAAAPSAFATPQELVLRGAGLSAPSGVVRTPDDARLVADHMLGVCRVTADGKALMGDAYCSDPEGTLPHVGPQASAGLVFDAATSSFYVGDIQSNLGGVWRLHWDAATGRVDAATKIVALGDDRVTAIALAPGANGAPASLLYTTKRAAAVMQVKTPATGTTTPVAVGFAQQNAASGIAVLGSDVYLAEGGSVTRFSLAGGSRTAVAVAGTEGIAATAIAADAVRGLVFAGTSYPGLTDDVVVIDPSATVVETYERGFAGVTGLGVDTDGTLLVADDPGVAAANIDSLHQGRLFGVPSRAVGRGQVTITAAPAPWTSARSVTFAYTGTPHSTFECRLDGAGDQDWVACDGYGRGTVRFDGLEEGTHVFEIRATTKAGTGDIARRVFVIDRTAPSVTITAPAAGAAVLRGTGRIDMVASEPLVTFSCSIDGAPATECDPGEALPVLALGDHTLRVAAVDAAGNQSAADAAGSVVRFSVVTPPPVVTPAPVTPAPQPAAPQQAAPAPQPAAVEEPTPAAPAAPAAPVAETAPVAAAAAPAPAPAAFVPRGAVAGVSAVSAPRLGSLRLRPRKVAWDTVARTVRLELEAGTGARVAHVTIRRIDKGGHTHIERNLRVHAGRNRLAIRLSGRQVHLMRLGRYSVSVSLRGAQGLRSNVLTRVLRITVR